MKKSVACKRSAIVNIVIDDRVIGKEADLDYPDMAEKNTGQITIGDAKMDVVNSPADTFTAEYEVLAYLGSGSFSHVLKCRQRQTGRIFACKKLNRPFKKFTEPREVYAAVKIKAHPNVVKLMEIYFDPPSGKVSLLYELMDSDLKVLTTGPRSNGALHDNLIRSVMSQIMTGISHLHGVGIMHCDLKPENVLLKMPGHVVKLGDMGNVQGLNEWMPRSQCYVASRWYRPPECLLTFGYYGPEMDIWAAGCIFYELMEHQILFRGMNEMDQMDSIRRTLGPMPLTIVREYIDHLNREIRYHGQVSPKCQQRIQNVQRMLGELNKSQNPMATGSSSLEKDRPQNCIDKIQNPQAKSLLLEMLQYDPKLRPTADAAISHVYFKEKEREE